MKKKFYIGGIIIIIAAILVYFLFLKSDAVQTNKFVFAPITKGDLNTTITSTGALQAVSTVDVGTQVSGKIDKIFVDFNTNVKRGQILAILDTTNLALQVSNAITNLQKTQAQYDVTKAQFDRDKSLHEKGFMSDLDFIISKSNYETAEANLKSAKTSLAQAKTNLGYAFIYSPIYGKILNRNVEEGQTVAASFSSPILFTIAEDLSKMQILANVDESDIGQIKVGQEAKFTVQAYPDKEFTGKVVQIRLGSSVISNVVNYTVVVTANNIENLLLPGMTATIDFYVEQRTDVLMIPNAALRFQPTEQMRTEYLSRMQKERENLPDSLKQKFQSPGGNGNSQNRTGGFGSGAGNKSRGTFWYIDDKGNPAMGFAQLGLSDGKNTEIVRSRFLKEGTEVITGFETANDTKTQNTNILNPGMRRF
ncbi:MAG TPA: efflux RND transporter periplasmic adaptor subunit [Ignavibacteriales bacterium]|nr:efflux RND transporter periplasmic adaptor subunit [Ignavibacteriales bacterium]